MKYKGWHSRGYLPHFDSAETVQFVTFRLADSLPRSVADALAKLPDNLAETDLELDRGMGSCWLKEPLVAHLVEDAIMFFDGERYRLFAWCVMPNHVHVVVEFADGHSLGAVVRSWKSFTANRANKALGRSGAFWHRDYFDRSTRGICCEPLTTSKTIRSKLVWRFLQLTGSGARRDAAHERARGSRSARL